MAVLVDGDAFRHFRLRIGRGDEGRHLAVLDAADADALPERRVHFVARLRVGDIEDVVADIDAARTAELLPLGDEFSVLIENLHAIVRPVGDVKPARRIHSQPMGDVELALSRTMVAPGLDEFAVARIFDDAVVGLVAVAVGDEDIAIRRDYDVGRAVELVIAIAGDARLADRHQHPPIGTEFYRRFAAAIAGLAIGDPDIAVAVSTEAMWPVDQARAEAHHLPAGGVEFLDRRDARADAGFAAATVVDPKAGAVAVDIDADRLAPRPALGQLRPMLDDVIRIWRAVRIVGLDLADGQCHGAKNGRADEADANYDSHALTHGNSSPSIRTLYCDSSTQACAFLRNAASARRRKCRNCHFILDRDTDTPKLR